MARQVVDSKAASADLEDLAVAEVEVWSDGQLGGVSWVCTCGGSGGFYDLSERPSVIEVSVCTDDSTEMRARYSIQQSACLVSRVYEQRYSATGEKVRVGEVPTNRYADDVHADSPETRITAHAADNLVLAPTCAGL